MRWPLLTFVLPVVLACSGDRARGGGGITPPERTGLLQMTVYRSLASNIPSLADSAVITVSSNFANQAKAMALPAPGTSASLTFTLPPGDGYRIGVVAYRSLWWGREGFALGRTFGVNIVAGQQTTASVSVVPVEVTIVGPDTLLGSEVARYKLAFSTGTFDPLNGPAGLRMGIAPWSADEPLLNNEGGKTAADTVIVGITAPVVTADTAIYLQAIFNAFGTTSNVVTAGIYFYSPSLSLGQKLHRVSVIQPRGNLIVTF